MEKFSFPMSLSSSFLNQPVTFCFAKLGPLNSSIIFKTHSTASLFLLYSEVWQDFLYCCHCDWGRGDVNVKVFSASEPMPLHKSNPVGVMLTGLNVYVMGLFTFIWQNAFSILSLRIVYKYYKNTVSSMWPNFSQIS